MNRDPNYTFTPLSSYLYKKVLKAGHPNGFYVYNFGDGPTMGYRTHQCRVRLFSLYLTDGSQKIQLSHNSPPPYLAVLLQEQPDQPILTVVYAVETEPVLEQSEENRLTGQILACGQSRYNGEQTVGHALYLPQNSQIFAAESRYSSMLMDGGAEVCRHLLTCGNMIDGLLHNETSAAEAEVKQNGNITQLYGRRELPA